MSKEEKIETINKQEPTQDTGEVFLDDQIGTQDQDDEDGEDQYAQDEDEVSASPKRTAHFDAVDSFFYISMGVIGDIGDSFWITRVFFGPATIAWLYLKGVDAIGKNVVAQAAELIPMLGWLPISTVAAILTIWQTNNPESFARTFGLAAQAMDATKKLKKK